MGKFDRQKTKETSEFEQSPLENIEEEVLVESDVKKTGVETFEDVEIPTSQPEIKEDFESVAEEFIGKIHSTEESTEYVSEKEEETPNIEKLLAEAKLRQKNY